MQAPFASTSLAALRLLAGFVLISEETAGGRATLLAHAGAEGARPCRALAAVLGALHRHACMHGVLDGILAATLGREGRRYAGLSPAELEACWRLGRDSFEGRALAALLWQVARRPEPALRALESEIASACSSRRLLSPEDLGSSGSASMRPRPTAWSSRPARPPRPFTTLGGSRAA